MAQPGYNTLKCNNAKSNARKLLDNGDMKEKLKTAYKKIWEASNKDVSLVFHKRFMYLLQSFACAADFITTIKLQSDPLLEIPPLRYQLRKVLQWRRPGLR